MMDLDFGGEITKPVPTYELDLQYGKLAGPTPHLGV
jgi:hypothetical protein